MSSLTYYKVFHRAVMNGSITKAAEDLYITQPSASYAVRQLEEQLGVRLLVRKSKGVELTEEGRVLFRFVEQAFGLLQAGERKIGEMKSYLSGVVRLGASDSLCRHVVLPFLESFHGNHPGIRIRLTHGKSEDLLKRLDAGDIDCGIVHMPAGDAVRVTAQRTVRDCFVAGPAYARLAESPVPLKELVREPFIMLSAESRTRSFLRAFLQTHGLELEPEIELGNIDLGIEFAARNMGVCYVNRDFVRTELETGTLLEIRTAEPVPERSIGVVTAEEQSLSLAAALFVGELSDHVGDSA
ncbi:LysR family transcriptional regulator [Paenibacillus hemerocallicola]|uniref:LysR family transcriptional regulator n=1 Tax=Paenibacillus hemerocallicola TaxID=1172614 RepID=A0A5C4SXL5_9BACL|nr:LysR family transcriptional regulator [Paenibacillus hemerocallicola]TNJ60626.1 LysR family transcriptional regulator [Paenibacillus hemerocallicola]